jgi:hypothetical protein
MMTEPEMIVAFETVLRESFGLDPASCRESEDAWRFEVEGLRVQGGIHRADVRVMTLLCKLSTDPDILDALYADLRLAEPPGLASFKESDCYLYAWAQLPFAAVSQAGIEQMIRDCVAAAKSPAASSLKSKWRNWDD